MKEFLSLREVCEKTGLSRRTLYRMIRAGKLLVVRPMSGRGKMLVSAGEFERVFGNSR